jgi:hypothetical protein
VLHAAHKSSVLVAESRQPLGACLRRWTPYDCLHYGTKLALSGLLWCHYRPFPAWCCRCQLAPYVKKPFKQFVPRPRCHASRPWGGHAAPPAPSNQKQCAAFIRHERVLCLPLRQKARMRMGLLASPFKARVQLLRCRQQMAHLPEAKSNVAQQV